MELIEKIGTRWHSNHFRRFGKFVCPFCGDVVERMIAQGHKAKSCGCATHLKARVIHGESRSRLYCTWVDMKSRCLNHKNARYHRYGGRGIKLYPAWIDFAPFSVWAKESGYAENLTIDRIDNDGNYYPDNCRWVTLQENLRNGRSFKNAGRTHTPKKLTADIVVEMRKLFSGKHGDKARIARMFNVSARCAGLVIDRKSWGHI